MTTADPRSGRPEDTGPERRLGFDQALDGELPPEAVERMRRHIAGCPECEREWEQVRRIKELVRRSFADRAPSALRERITVQCRSVSISRTEADGSTVRVTRTTTTTRRTVPPKSSRTSD